MTRRELLAAFLGVPVVRAFDLVKVTIRVDKGPLIVWWEPRDVAERRFANAIALLRYPPKNARPVKP
jgi:hypothetical protein